MKKKNTYIKKLFNFLIDFLFFAFFIAMGFGIYLSVHYVLQKIPELDNLYGTLISVSVTIILAIISYSGKIKKFMPDLLHRIKQNIYLFFSWKYNPFSAFTIIDYNQNNFYETNDQSNFIEMAIGILKNITQDIILISGYSGEGKTTSIMLLLNAIAHDKELYYVFSELQNHIIYFDSINDRNTLIHYLESTETQKCKLIIIDNIQKFNLSFMNEVMQKVNNLTLHNKNAKKKVLVIFLYQERPENKALLEYIKNKFFKDKNKIFRLERYINLSETEHLEYFSASAQELKLNIKKIDDSFFQKYLYNILNNRKDDSITDLLNTVLFQPSERIPRKKEKAFFVLTSVIFVGLYNGYVTKKDLYLLWIENYTFFSLFQENFLIKYYTRNYVLMPFPFIYSAYMFNEQLAAEYRKRLIQNDYYKETSNKIAKLMFIRCEENMPQKWLLFLLCAPEYCEGFSQHKRIHYFENTLSIYHLQYILKLVETELDNIPDKKKIFRQELGIIYIYNGQWAKAKKILYPYIRNHNINKDIWHIQLKIIEAEHGGNDKKYLEMLDCMENECTDSVILFQIKYWREHICMEHGEFILDTWKELTEEARSNPALEELRKNNHLLTRIISDYERTYFLKGIIKYSYYKNIISQYTLFNHQSLEVILSRAYYIQYDILFQVGIWGYTKYNEIDPEIIQTPNFSGDSNTMNILVDEALDKYNYCIQKYQSEGKKKYRTLEVRKAELILCTDSNNYIEILNQYEKFEHYAKENDITVFKGYCNTQKGKAFALYADYMFRHNDMERFEEYLSKAKEYLKEAQSIYTEWGNNYGAFRAELLIIIVDMIQRKENPKTSCFSVDIYENTYRSMFLKLGEKYNSQKQYIREYNLIQYLQKNISKIDLPLRILKFYPIILQ